MSLLIGIVGLPNVGKSSLFNALTNSNVLVENRPFATINPNIGVVQLSDPRLDKLVSVVNPDKTTHSFIKFVDIAGLVKGASQGAGLGNKFLENIRMVDAICLVVRTFGDSDVFSVNSNVDPILEAEIVLTELIYSDLDMIENILKKLKSNDKKIQLLNNLKKHLQEEKLISNFDFSEEDKQSLKIYSFLTNKPILLVANTDDSEFSAKWIKDLQTYANKIKAKIIDLNIKLELELLQLTPSERKDFLLYLGKEGSALQRLVSLAFSRLGLSTFFTAGKKEVRSWTFRNGSTAQECAGLIHSDIKKGFIKARIIKYLDFEQVGDLKLLREEGKVSLEGKDYLMQDGDIAHFEFNV